MDDRPVSILLVEDEEQHAELVCHAFANAPGARWADLTVAGSLAEARTCLAESEPDLIIVDWLLPDGRGTEILPLEGQEPRFPVVVLTNHGDEQVAVQAIKAGALDYVVKSTEVLANMPGLAERALREWGHIAERRRAEEALRDSENRFRALIDQSPICTIIYHPDGRAAYGNSACVSLYNMSEPEYEFVINEYNILKDELLEANGLMPYIRKGFAGEATAVPPIAYEREVQGGNQELHHVAWVEGFVYPIKDDQGQVREVVVVNSDISERVRAEKELQESLRVKEVLLKEIHHRVKNNLQVVSSLLQLQSESVDDALVHRLFDESRDRIRAMSLVHEWLYDSQDLGRISTAEYFQDLVQQLVNIYVGPATAICPQMRVEDFALDIDTAIPCGLILTELVSNALQHAFPSAGSDECSVGIEMHRGEDAWLTLAVGDNGVGLPAGFDWRNTESLGLQLVRMLVNQLGGTIDLDRCAGTVFTITFPTSKA